MNPNQTKYFRYPKYLNRAHKLKYLIILRFDIQKIFKILKNTWSYTKCLKIGKSEF